METKEIVSNVKKLFKKGEICEEWYLKMLENDSIENLCKMWFKGSDWSVKNNFPNLETLRLFKGKSDQFGLFTDFRGEVSVNLKQMAFFGVSDAEITFLDYDVSQIYLRDNSVLKIFAGENTIIEINVLDHSKVEIFGNGNVSVYGNKNNVKWN